MGNKLIAIITLGILLPSQIVVAPVFILIRDLGLSDTHWALILTVSAFNISISTLIAAGFLRSIPREVEEAAVIDGAGALRIFFPGDYPYFETRDLGHVHQHFS